MTFVVGAAFVLYSIGIVSLAWNTWRTVGLTSRQEALPAPPQDWQPPSFDVFVPVKDEEGHIATCLNSVLNQDYPSAKVTVVNDRSTDRTLSIVESIQRRHSLLRCVTITELPEGLYGKPHGLSKVSSDVRSEYAAFVDSDLELHPDCLKTLVYHLESNGLDWVAAMGSPKTFYFWERLTIPIFGAMTFAWYDPRKINDPEWPDAIGSGLMVCRRSAYEAIGGHDAVIRVYDEDSELLRIAKRAGQKVSFILTPDLFTQRHYGTLADTSRGMTRTCVGGIKTLPRILVTINALSFVSLLPVGLLFLLGVAATFGWQVTWAPLWWTAAGAHLAVSTVLAWLVFRAAKGDRKLALLHPLGSVVALYVCVCAMLHLSQNRAITWRGTQYQ